MPASATRPCTNCGVEKTKAERRDSGVTRGRPPGTCRDCRARYPELEAHQAKNRLRRPEAVQRQRAYARRWASTILKVQARKYPTGRKRCARVAGCGKKRALSKFSPNRYQYDGLLPVCVDCESEYPMVSKLVKAVG